MSATKALARFSAKIDKSPGHGPDGECWMWTAGKNSSTDDYGCFWYQGRTRLAHRVAYRLHKGEIPDDKHVLHSCDNRACVNPGHLSLGTDQDNMDQMVARGRAATGDRNGTRTCPESRPRGERVAGAKLTPEHVREIRQRYSTGNYSRRSLARSHGVSTWTIGRIIHHEGWRHVS